MRQAGGLVEVGALHKGSMFRFQARLLGVLLLMVQKSC